MQGTYRFGHDVTILSLVNMWHRDFCRNVFFPWQTVCIHRSGAFLEDRRMALRVPTNLTKTEIKEYLEKIYNAKVLKVNTLIKVPERRRNLDDKRCKPCVKDLHVHLIRQFALY